MQMVLYCVASTIAKMHETRPLISGLWGIRVNKGHWANTRERSGANAARGASVTAENERRNKAFVARAGRALRVLRAV